MELLLKDSLNKGHHRNYLPTKDTFGITNSKLSYSTNTTFPPVKSGQPLYSGQSAGPNVSFIKKLHCMFTIHDL